jgi:hypothetical protein
MKSPKDPKDAGRKPPEHLMSLAPKRDFPAEFYDIINALMLLNGEIQRDGPIEKTVFPTSTTKPTEGECYASMARALEVIADGHEDDEGQLLRALAGCFDPNSKHRRLVEVRNRGKDVETDQHRDESIAWQVWKLAKTKGKKRAIGEVAALIGRSEKAVKDARKRVAKRYKERGLRDLEKLHT